MDKQTVFWLFAYLYGGKMITVHYEQKPIYDIYIENNYDKLQEAIMNLPDVSAKKVCIVSETNVAPLYMDEVRRIAEKCF